MRWGRQMRCESNICLKRDPTKGRMETLLLHTDVHFSPGIDFIIYYILIWLLIWSVCRKQEVKNVFYRHLTTCSQLNESRPSAQFLSHMTPIIFAPHLPLPSSTGFQQKNKREDGRQVIYSLSRDAAAQLELLHCNLKSAEGGGLRRTGRGGGRTTQGELPSLHVERGCWSSST